MKKGKEPYVVVFDPASGLKQSTPQSGEAPSVERQYGDLRIRSGGNTWGGVEWMVWSITKNKWVIEISQEDLDQTKAESTGSILSQEDLEQKKAESTDSIPAKIKTQGGKKRTKPANKKR